ncbi:hypothetical protein L1887_01169 [Cichorium endivia]|nr:hypothetical protein L1887_01169 [Cichorium endivia]
MGWVWKDDDDDRNSGEISGFKDLNARSEAGCSTRKIISSQCRTEEVEPGKFIRKCEKTEQLLRDSIGRPSEVVQSNKEYTEEDVTEQMTKGSLPIQSSQVAPFDFPGLRSDIEAIERSLFGNMNRFFEAAEGLFSLFGPPHLHEEYSKSLPRHSEPTVPIQPRPPKTQDGVVDLSDLARDV